MTTITLKCHVYQYGEGDGTRYSAFSFRDDKNLSGLYVGEFDHQFAIPADFNPVAARLNALAAEREEAGKLFADTVRRIDAEIGKLTAISNEVTA